MVAPLISVRSAVKRFRLDSGKEIFALDSVSLEILGKDFLFVMGANGSGKTTLLRAIDLGVTLDEGTIDFEQPLSREKITFLHLSQDPRARMFDRLTLAEHFLLSELNGRRPRFFSTGVGRARRKRYAEILERYDRMDLAAFLDRPVSELSGGMRQAAALLTALAGAAPARELVLLLDEPTSALDLDNERRCLDLVRRLNDDGATVIFVTHDPALVSGGTALVIMERGRVVSTHRGNELSEMDSIAVARLLEAARNRALTSAVISTGGAC